MLIQTTSLFVSPNAVKDGQLTLDASESHHLMRVMRADMGDTFLAIDGQGRKFTAKIKYFEKGIVTADIIDVKLRENELAVDIAIVCGLCRPAKADLIVEKTTELGAATIGFCLTDKSYNKESKPLAENRRLRRWHSIATSAAKQSLRSVVPQILPIGDFRSTLNLSKKYDLKIIADLEAERKIPDLLTSGLKPKSAFLFVGPESGFTCAEIEAAVDVGFEKINLGNRRLRAETAAICLLSIIGNHLEQQ